MRNFIAMMMVLSLFGFAVAQDLDAPTSGTPNAAADEADGQTVFSGVYDALIARVQAAEGVSLNRAGWEFKTMGWLFALSNDDGAGFLRWADLESPIYSFVGDYESLSGAEQAAFNEVIGEAWEGIQLAAGLN